MSHANFSPQHLTTQEIAQIKNQTKIDIFASSPTKSRLQRKKTLKQEKSQQKPQFAAKTYQNSQILSQKTQNPELLNENIGKLQKKMLQQMQIHNYENNINNQNLESNLNPNQDLNGSYNLNSSFQQMQNLISPKKNKRIEEYKQNVFDRYQNFQNNYQSAYYYPQSSQKSRNSEQKSFYNIMNYSYNNNQNLNQVNVIDEKKQFRAKSQQQQQNQISEFQKSNDNGDRFQQQNQEQNLENNGKLINDEKIDDQFLLQQNEQNDQQQQNIDIDDSYFNLLLLQQQEQQRLMDLQFKLGGNKDQSNLDQDQNLNLLSQSQNNEIKFYNADNFQPYTTQNVKKNLEHNQSIKNKQSNKFYKTHRGFSTQHSKFNNQNTDFINLGPNQQDHKPGTENQHVFINRNSIKGNKLKKLQITNNTPIILGNINQNGNNSSQKKNFDIKKIKKNNIRLHSVSYQGGVIYNGQDESPSFSRKDQNVILKMELGKQKKDEISQNQNQNSNHKNKNKNKSISLKSPDSIKINSPNQNQNQNFMKYSQEFNIQQELDPQLIQIKSTFIKEQSEKDKTVEEYSKSIGNFWKDFKIYYEGLKYNPNFKRIGMDMKNIMEEVEVFLSNFQQQLLKKNQEILELNERIQKNELKMQQDQDDFSHKKKQMEENLSQAQQQFSQKEQDFLLKISQLGEKDTQNQKKFQELTQNLENFEKSEKKLENDLKDKKNTISLKEQEIQLLQQKLVQQEENLQSQMQSLQKKFENLQNQQQKEKNEFLTNQEEQNKEIQNQKKKMQDLNQLIEQFTSQNQSKQEMIEELQSKQKEQMENMSQTEEKIQQINKQHLLRQKDLSNQLSVITNVLKVFYQDQKFQKYKKNESLKIGLMLNKDLELHKDINELNQFIELKVYFVNELLDIESTLTQISKNKISGTQIFGQNSGKINEFEFSLNFADLPKNIRLIILTVSKNQEFADVWKKNGLDFKRAFQGQTNIYQKGKIVDYHQLKNFDQNDYEFLYLINNGLDWQIKKTDIKKEKYDNDFVQQQAKQYFKLANIKISPQLQQALDWNLDSKYSIKLKPGDIIPMPNISYQEFTIGLGWDCDEGEIDCDASVIFFNEEKKYIGQVDFETGKSKDGAVIHQGDNRSGDKEGDDEEIIVHLDLLSKEIHQIWVLVSIYDDGKFFDSITGSYSRFVIKGKEFLKFDIVPDKIGKKNGLLMCNLEKHGERWICKGVGAFCEGVQCVEQVIPFIQPFLDKK